MMFFEILETTYKFFGQTAVVNSLANNSVSIFLNRDSTMKSLHLIHRSRMAYVNGTIEQSLSINAYECSFFTSVQWVFPQFLGRTCHTVIYTLNRTGSHLIPGNTPFTLWYGFKPSLEHLRVFGCQAYAFIDKQHRTKLDPKSHLCFFLGYCDHTKGYRLWDPVTSKVLIR